MVLPGAKTRAFFSQRGSFVSRASANSQAMIVPISMVLPAPMARARI
jgi:hypothetical protein